MVAIAFCCEWNGKEGKFTLSLILKVWRPDLYSHSIPWCIGVWMSILLTETTPPCLSFTVMSSREGRLSVTERVQTASSSSAHWNKTPKSRTLREKKRKQTYRGYRTNYLHILDNDRKAVIHTVSWQQVLAVAGEGEKLVVKRLEVRLTDYQTLAWTKGANAKQWIRAIIDFKQGMSSVE